MTKTFLVGPVLPRDPISAGTLNASCSGCDLTGSRLSDRVAADMTVTMRKLPVAEDMAPTWMSFGPPDGGGGGAAWRGRLGDESVRDAVTRFASGSRPRAA